MSSNLTSINVSAVRSVNGSQPTGIYKEPVAGPTPLGHLGVQGDQQKNKRYHGGPDQAVYLYASEDTRWWSEQLDVPLGPGAFGENLTLDRFPEPVRIGDRLRIGAVLLEVTGPRIPCATLAFKMGDPRFVKRFAQAGRPGYYARVLTPGILEPGPVKWESSRHLTGLEMFHMLLGKPDEAQLRRALEAPLGERFRESFEGRR